jgi:hypothetical protein
MDELAGVPAVLLSQNADVLAANKAARAHLPRLQRDVRGISQGGALAGFGRGLPAGFTTTGNGSLRR